ncbi:MULTISPECIES: ECF transporter S component [unclassified Streptomyces]|uniref:ECF transporter S component n=1 Tax=unclassified Streptomyces TaxID=2593676 RepID=UPI00081BB1BE|nr:ECF transporter S component [Streptomyces sp. DvalAA-43]MYQ89084.1 ECF transporter S component [Streptomyces sp. SID4936]SCE57506.1 energy-coupling factor transport system substrate-specific component [Streptomyces sp. DvalAA-43]
MSTYAAAIRLRPRAGVVIALAAALGVVAFFWPFLVAPGTFGSNCTPLLVFGALLVIVLCVVISEIAEGGINSKALAMLGVPSAVNAAVRPLGAGTAGTETVFFILVLAGLVYGSGFGFTLGCASLFASALITGGVGPWMPSQMFGCAFVGMLAGFLPRATGRREVLMLAVYGSLSGYLFGFLLNLSFWPFSLDSNSSIAYLPGLPFTEQFQRYIAFDLATSLGWDTGRAVTNLVCVTLAGPAVLTVFRRAARKARFQTPVRFARRDAGPDAAA